MGEVTAGAVRYQSIASSGFAAPGKPLDAFCSLLIGVHMTSEMERRKRPDSAGKGHRRGQSAYQTDSEFVNYELKQEQVVEYRRWRADIETVDLAWREACEDGYKFSAKYDDYNSAFAVFMLPGPDSENAGFILTGRGGTPLRALCECLFKHSEVLGGDWRSVRRSSVSTDDPEW